VRASKRDPNIERDVRAVAEEIDRANRLILAYENSLAAGKGACIFEGKMIDVPMVSALEA